MIKFEWDENKNRTNQNKHGISFAEAQTVFYDDEALVIDDPEHSEEEERFIILGLSNKANLLVVCHCYRASETVIRIISARKATKTESQYYGKWGDEYESRIWFLQRKKKPLRKTAKKANHHQHRQWSNRLLQKAIRKRGYPISNPYQSIPERLRPKRQTA